MFGKREEERGQRLRVETNESSGQSKSFSQQPQAATRGSLEIDLETTIDVVLNDTTVHEIPSNAVEPRINSNSRMKGLLVGRSSAGVKGLLIVPRVIDANYADQIHIMVHTLCPPLFVPKGSKTAQVLVIGSSIDHSLTKTSRENRSLDSTDPAVCFTTKMDHRPNVRVVLSQKNASVQIYAMLDTGADITIVSMRVWPEEWPLSVPTTAIAGVGGRSAPMMSQYPVQITFPEGQEFSLKVYVMQLPKTLSALIG